MFFLALAFNVAVALALRKRRRPEVVDVESDQWAQAVMTCADSPPAATTMSMTIKDYDAVFASVASRYNGLPTECNATFCPQADWSGCVLRAAGHDFMDFDGTGGADGCLDLHDKDNGGLHECLYKGEFGVSILQAYQEHCSRVSLADFLVISGETVMHLARQHVLDLDASRAPIEFRSKFRFGRTTAETCTWALGRLPDPEHSCTAVQKTFVERMGLSWSQSAALMGTHTLGRAEVKNSGYDGFWSDANNSKMFNNDYYTSILNKGWRPEAVAGNPLKNQWYRADVGNTDDTRGKEMMLNTDLCLAYTMGAEDDKNNITELNAATTTCCAWRFANARHRVPDDRPIDWPDENYIGLEADQEFCGVQWQDTPAHFFRQWRQCCQNEGRFDHCGSTRKQTGPASAAVKAFALSEEEWLKTFMEAWKIATENGATGLQQLADA